MTRIAYIVSNPCTTDARVIKIARAAVAAGHEVHMFATLGPGTSSYQQVAGITYHRLEWRPSEIMRRKSAPLALLSKLNRSLAAGLIKCLMPFGKYRMFSEVFAPYVAALRPDIIHAHDLICLPAAYDAAKVCGARLVYDAHELEVHRNPPLPFFQKRFVSYTEGKYGRRADAVITVGRMVGEVLGAHLGRKDINVIYNSPIIEPCLRNVRSDLGVDSETPVLLYVGKVTAGRGVGEFLAILPKLRGVLFATVGPCDDKIRMLLERQADRVGVSARFRILPSVPFEQVVDYIKGADLGIISVEPVSLSYQYCMPNKLFEMSFANVPIISNELDEIREYLEENGNGELTDFDDKTTLLYIIERMLSRKETLKLDERRMLELAAKYSWDAQAAKLGAIYQSLLPPGQEKELVRMAQACIVEAGVGQVGAARSTTESGAGFARRGISISNATRQK
jgi:glycosyltransferase involved in cell wall biosynthesis